MVQKTCARANGKRCDCKMSPLKVDLHPQSPACRGQIFSKEVRCSVCANWIDAQWKTDNSISRACRRKVGGMIPSGGWFCFGLAYCTGRSTWGLSSPCTSASWHVSCGVWQLHPSSYPAATCCHHPRGFTDGNFSSCYHGPSVISYFFAYYVDDSVDDEACDMWYISHGVIIHTSIIASTLWYVPPQ